MFDKKNPTPPANLPSVDDKDFSVPGKQSVDKQDFVVEKKEKSEVEDMFDSVEPTNKGGAVVSDKLGKNSTFSPDTPSGVSNNEIKDRINRADNEMNKATSTKGGKKTLVIALILVLLIGIGGSAWYYVSFVSSENDVIDISESVDIGNTANMDTNNDDYNNEPVMPVDPVVPSKSVSDVDVDMGGDIDDIDYIEPVMPVEPVVVDTDSDGLSDDREKILGTNINMADTDGDGLLDKEEVDLYGTNPLNPDTDGDGYADGSELSSGYDPNGPGKLPIPSEYYYEDDNIGYPMDEM